MRLGRILPLAVTAALLSTLLALQSAAVTAVGTPGSDHVIGTPGPDKFHLWTETTWSKPAVSNPTWEGRYQQCHRSKLAYSTLVAGHLNADISSFACTGASYGAGVTGTQPFQQGNVPAQLEQLADSKIKPDLIL